MFLTLWRKLMNSMSRASRLGHTPARRKPSCRPQLEYLEDRLVPATHTWTGMGGDNLWSNPKNWNGGTPAGDTAADVSFPEDSRWSAPLPQPIFLYNDLDGLTIRSITLSNKINEYGLNGDPITLTGDIWDGGRHSFQGNRINFDVALTPAPHNLSCLGGDLIFGGAYGSSGAISLSKWGAGEVELDGGGIIDYGVYAGPTTIYEGTLAAYLPSDSAVTVMGGATWLSDDLNTGIDSIGSLAGAGTVVLPGGFSDNIITHVLFTGLDDTSTTFSGVMSGSGTLYKEGTGTFTLTGPIAVGGQRQPPRIDVGAIQVDAGTLQLGVSNVIAPTCAVTVNAGPVLARARLDLNGHSDAIGSLSGVGAVTLGGGSLSTGNDDTSTTFGGVISGAGSLYKEGAGTFTLSPGTYTGRTEIDQGTLQIGSSSTVPAASAVIVAAGATFDLNNFVDSIEALSGAGHVTLGSGSLYTGYIDRPTTFSGIISGKGSLYKEGFGTFTLTGPNTYATTVIDDGTLLVGTADAIPASGAVVVNAAGTFNCNNLDVTIGSLSGKGSVNLGSGALYIVAGGSANVDFGGVVSGSGSLYKEGAGTLSLSGANTYTGETYVYGGTLLVTGSLSPSGTVEITSGAALWGSGTVGNVDVISGGLLFPNVNGGKAVLKTGKVCFGSASIFTVILGGQSLSASGTVDLSNGPTLNSQLGQFQTKIGGAYTIIQGAAIIGTFQGLSEHSRITIGSQVFLIHYAAASVVLTRIF